MAVAWGWYQDCPTCKVPKGRACQNIATYKFRPLKRPHKERKRITV